MTAERPSWAPTDVDPSRPSVARVYDFYLGGSHNFESDREFGQHVLEAMPNLPSILRDNREFLRRAVLYMSAQGVDQFLDLGSGIPTLGNVHEVAQAVNPQARIVYVDHDPVAVTHSRALLEGNERATAIGSDVREPAEVLAGAVATGLIDLTRPLGIMLIAVVHFVDDAERPVEFIAEYMRATVPGSYLAITHGRRDGQVGLRDAAKVYEKSTSPNPMKLRTLPEVQALFGDLTMVEPGVVLMPRWRPELTDDSEDPPEVDDDYPGFAGLGRRD